MYGRMLIFQTDNGKSACMQDIAEKLDEILQKTKGFISAIYLTDETIGEHGALILWDSEQHAREARRLVFMRLKELLNDLLVDSIWFPLFKVVK